MIRRPPRSTPLPLHDALPIWQGGSDYVSGGCVLPAGWRPPLRSVRGLARRLWQARPRSEEHTSELQSRQYLVCRLLLEKKKTKISTFFAHYYYLTINCLTSQC